MSGCISYQEFVKDVCLDCFKITEDKFWSQKVINWFYRNDFDPSSWEEDYLRIVADL